MTPDEMRARSKEKVKMITDLARTLHIKIECREKITEEGFIEKVIFFVDNEKYPEAPAAPLVPPATPLPPGALTKGDADPSKISHVGPDVIPPGPTGETGTVE